MFFPTLYTYTREVISSIPWTHWAVIGILSFVFFLLARKRTKGYGAFALGISAFIGLFLLDASVLIRYCGFSPHSSGYDFNVDLNRILHSSGLSRVEVLSNFAVYLPLGFFLSEYLTETKRFRVGQCLGFATLIAFCLSICVECLQLAFHVGYFELVDLLLNTLGGFFGASLAMLGRRIMLRMNNT